MNHDAIAWIAAHGGDDVKFKHAGDYLNGVGPMEGWSTYVGQSTLPRQNSIGKHIDLDNGHLLMLEIFPTRMPGSNDLSIRWNSILLVAEGRYVRVHGQADDFATALVQAESYEHQNRQIGSLTWWKESEKRWVSWLGQTSLEANCITTASEPSGTPYWHFQVLGSAASLEEAALLAAMRQPT